MQKGLQDIYMCHKSDEVKEDGPPTCIICGQPMPEGEEMFQFHGYSGPCPKE